MKAKASEQQLSVKNGGADMTLGHRTFRVKAHSTCFALAMAIACQALAMGVSHAQTSEFDGMWATNPDRCQDIFVKRGNEVVFSDKADMYGSGFIVSGKTIRGKIAVCKVQSLKKSGNTANIRAACATDISVSTNNFGLRLVDANKLVRSIPGVPELDTSYFRCVN
jgi:hypothetical protein